MKSCATKLQKADVFTKPLTARLEFLHAKRAIGVIGPNEPLPGMSADDNQPPGGRNPHADENTTRAVELHQNSPAEKPNEDNPGGTLDVKSDEFIQELTPGDIPELPFDPGKVAKQMRVKAEKEGKAMAKPKVRLRAKTTIIGTQTPNQ